ncbi:MAG: hypothetical protein Q9194_003248 [Teloschistes cf. exilis]
MAANLFLVSPRWGKQQGCREIQLSVYSASSFFVQYSNSSYGRGRLDSHCAAKNGVSPRSQRLLSSFWAYSDCFRHIRDPNADTAALEGKYIELTTIHGRDFQTFSIENTIHLVPVDEEEVNRLEAQHQVLDIVFDGKLFFPPVSRVRNVLDCGYGAGSWAVEVAERDPNCTASLSSSSVIGVDISPHMKPDDMPDNFIPQVQSLQSKQGVRVMD